MSADRRAPDTGLVAAVLAGLALRASGILRGRPADPSARPSAAGPEPADGLGRETRDVHVGNAAKVMAALALSAILAVAVMVWLMGSFAARQRAALPALTPQQTARLRPPAPNLQADPYADLDRERAAAEAWLSGYGWVDPERTRARIPIGRAMELSVGRSLEPRSVPSERQPR